MLLSELQWEYPNVFAKPFYLIKMSRSPFTILLIDSSLPSKRRKLYSLSYLELDELKM